MRMEGSEAIQLKFFNWARTEYVHYVGIPAVCVQVLGYMAITGKADLCVFP